MKHFLLSLSFFQRLLLQKQFASGLLLVLLWVGFAKAPLLAQDGEKMQAQFFQKIETFERYYEDGDYQKALNKAQKQLNRYKKQDKGYFVTQLLPYLMRYQIAASDYAGFEKNIEAYLRYKNLKKDSPLNYAAGLLEVAQLYTYYGNPQRSNAYLNDIKARLDTLKTKPSEQEKLFFDEKIKAISLQNLFLEGNFIDFRTKSPEVVAILEKELTGGKTFFSDINHQQLETRPLSPLEQQQLHTQIAQLYTQNGKAALLYGDLVSALAFYQQADSYIKERLNTRGVAYIRNQTLEAEYAIAKGEEREQIRTLLEKNLYRAERAIGTVHQDYLHLHQLLIQYYNKSGFVMQYLQGEEGSADKKRKKGLALFLQERKYSRRSDRQSWELGKNMEKYYTKSRLPYLYKIKIEAQADFFSRRYEKAQEALETALADTNRLPLIHPERAVLLSLLYDILLAEDKFEEAQKVLQDFLAVQKNVVGEDANYYAFGQMRLAKHYGRFSGNFEASEVLFRENYNKLSEEYLPQSTQFLDAQNDYLEYLELKENFEQANVLAKRVLSAVETNYGANHLRYASQLEKTARLNMAQSRYKEVDAQIQKMLYIFEQQYNNSLSFEHGQILETAARYYLLMGLYDQAADLLKQAERRYRRAARSTSETGNQEDLAALYIQTDNYDAAAQILEKTLQQKEALYGKESRFLLNTYNRTAELRLLNGEHIEAESFIEQAEKIAKREFGAKSLRLTETLLIKARLKAALGDYAAAEEIALEVLTIKKEALKEEDHLDLASVYTQLAIFQYNNPESELSDQAKSKQIDEYLAKAEKIIDKNVGKQNPIYVQALRTRALLNLEKGNYEQVISDLQQANQTLDVLAIRSLTMRSEIDLLLADAYTQTLKIKDAEAIYKKTLKTYEKNFGKDHPTYLRTLGSLAQMYFIAKDYGKAREYSEEATQTASDYINKSFAYLNDREKLNYWGQIRQIFDFYTVLALQNQNPDMLGKLYNNLLFSKSVLLSASIKTKKAIESSSDTTLLATYQLLLTKKKELNQYIGLSEEELKEANIDLKKLEKEIAELDKNISRSVGTTLSQTDTWDKIKAQLKEKEYALEMVRYQHFEKDFTDSVLYAVLVIEKGSKSPKAIILPNGNQLEDEYMNFYRNSIIYQIEDFKSYERYWKKVDEQIPNEATVYFSGDGIYSQVNLETLLLDEENYLLEKRDLALLTSTADLLTPKGEDRLDAEIVLIGSPAFYDQNSKTPRIVSPLQGTKEEVKAIETQLTASNNANVVLKLEENATENFVKSIKNPATLHFATHGYFVPNSSVARRDLGNFNSFNNPLLRSGLLLARAGELMADNNFLAYNRYDGILTALEVRDALDLRNTNLVILSACETGRGDVKAGDGVYGLQRAFQIAGAKSLIMSLFKVDDNATRDLMTLFYKNYQQIKDKRKAFRQAKIELMKDYAEPIYWGAFVLIGR
ncbi:CHAT domain-containing protein [Hugenholtzia roseola]|uniref:CHAT domain-containing protein n=1 Tax=Hugenholtzia roseola TaxID=1002 RepID=UPI000427C56E|nr:CHAT domain-containing protein [Hugenholtzia roseola]